MQSRSASAIYGVLIAATLFFSLLQTVITPLMPYFKVRFDVDQEAITWLITGYLVVAAVATPLIGQLGDRFGRGTMMRITMIALFAGSVVAAIADSYMWLVISRMLQGLGGGLFPLAYRIIRDSFPPLKVAGGIGALSSVMAVGSGLGIVIVGPMTETFGHQAFFWIISAVGALAAVAVFVIIPTGDRGTKQPTDWIGIVLLSAWVVQLLYASTIGNRVGWFSPQVIGLVAGFAICLALWLAWESRYRYPLINLQTMRHKVVTRGNLVAFLFGAVMFSANTFVVAYAQSPTDLGFGLGVSVTVTGFIMLPQTFVSLVTGLTAGYVANRFGSRNGVVAGGILSTLGFAGMMFWNDSILEIVLLSLVWGFGVSLFFAQITNVILPAIPASETGAVTGMNNMIRNIGGALGGQICAVFVGMEAVSNGAFEGGFQFVFGFLAIMSLVACAVCMTIPKPEPARG